jgi:hypothetical protein
MSKIKGHKATQIIEDEAMHVGVDPAIGEDKTVVSVVGTKTGRLRSDQPNLARLPVRTEEAKELQRVVADETSGAPPIDYAAAETRMVASFGGAVIHLQPEAETAPVAERPRGRGRRDEVVMAVNGLKLGLELATLKHALGVGQNRRARRRVQALTVSLKRKLGAVGVTLEEALAAL